MRSSTVSSTYFNGPSLTIVATNCQLAGKTTKLRGCLEQACRALGHMSANDNNSVRSGAAFGIETLVAVLQNHPDGPFELLRAACMALRNVTCNNKDNKAKCGAASVIKVMATLLQKHLDGPVEFLDQACAAVCNITFDNDDNAAECGVAGLAEALKAVIQRHQHDDEDDGPAADAAALLGHARLALDIIKHVD